MRDFLFYERLCTIELVLILRKSLEREKENIYKSSLYFKTRGEEDGKIKQNDFNKLYLCRVYMY